MNLASEILGYFGGICIAVCFLPQTLQTIRSKNVQDLSLLSYIIYCTGVVSWILYGAYLRSPQMVIFNSISLCFSGTILAMIIKYKYKPGTKHKQ